MVEIAYTISQGYFQLDKFFDPGTELDPCREAIGGLVDELAQKLYKGGKIKSKAYMIEGGKIIC